MTSLCDGPYEPMTITSHKDLNRPEKYHTETCKSMLTDHQKNIITVYQFNVHVCQSIEDICNRTPCTKQNLLISFPNSNLITTGCNAMRLYNRLGGKPSTSYKHTKLLIFHHQTSEMQVIQMCGKGIIMRNNELILQYGNCSMEGVCRAQKNIVHSP
jgi:hypothetical protein